VVPPVPTEVAVNTPVKSSRLAAIVPVVIFPPSITVVLATKVLAKVDELAVVVSNLLETLAAVASGVDPLA